MLKKFRASREKFWQLDTGSIQASKTIKELSINDKKAITIWDNSLQFSAGHYTLEIPIKVSKPIMPNNKDGVRLRLEVLRRRLSTDANLHIADCKNIEDLLSKGYAERVPANEEKGLTGKVWYLPHHAVLNLNKPNKVRIVCDCASKYDYIFE